MKKLTHTGRSGKAQMVDISPKKETLRTASAYGEVILGKTAFNAVANNSVQKGDVLAAAMIAGIQAAKRTYELIPLCHNIPVFNIDIGFKLNKRKLSVEITSAAKTNARTGIEMEALTAVALAALTIYDMCKSAGKDIRLNNIHLVSKTGGRSGDYYNER